MKEEEEAQVTAPDQVLLGSGVIYLFLYIYMYKLYFWWKCEVENVVREYF